MRSRVIGSLNVSVIGLGCNQLGTKFCDQSTTDQIVGEALDAGVTYFDTADEYGQDYADLTSAEGWGRSESYLGHALGSRRDQVIIGSKFSARPHADEVSGGASAKWARIALEASLRRLGTDHIDLYQQHFPDPGVPIAETLGVLQEFVQAGKVREVGCCNFSAAELDAAAETAAKDAPSFASIQAPLNILQRNTLSEVAPAAARLGLALIPYYPLASGVLTGKYRRGLPPPEGSRMSDQVSAEARAKVLSDRTHDRLEALERFAAERDRSLVELAFGWLLGHPEVSTVIAGASKPGQVAANVANAGWVLSPDEVAEATSIAIEAGASR
jgi:aryl-alcohol dehydrogenase-like predicted oxidoreductase